MVARTKKDAMRDLEYYFTRNGYSGMWSRMKEIINLTNECDCDEETLNETISQIKQSIKDLEEKETCECNEAEIQDVLDLF